MTGSLGHLVFLTLAFVALAHSALTVPFWQHLPEVSRQEPEVDFSKIETEEDPKQVHLAHLQKFSPFQNLRVWILLRITP